MYSVSLCGGKGRVGTLQGMAGVISAPRIVFTFANVVLVGVFRWPPCHIVNSSPDAISKRVNVKYVDRVGRCCTIEASHKIKDTPLF